MIFFEGMIPGSWHDPRLKAEDDRHMGGDDKSGAMLIKYQFIFI
jgi:hypothetical protein